MNEKSEKVLEQYNISINRMIRGRGGIIIATGQGYKLFTQCEKPDKYYERENNITQILKSAGFGNTDTYVRNNEGQLVSQDEDGRRYILKDWFDAKESDVKDMGDMCRAVSMMAYLHMALREAAVISNNANAYALTRAKENGIPAYCVSPKDYATRDEFNKALLEKVNSLNVDLVVLAGFLVKIPEEMVHEYSHRIINIHPSLIPSFCGVGFYGLHVHEAALAKGVKVTGATVHYVDEGMDTGEIIFQKAVEVKDGDTPEILQKRVMEQAEWKLLPAAINKIANEHDN